MEFLIDHLPRTVQVAVAGRSDPPLALARLRASAELLEMRVEDLRLSTGEATALLNGSLRLGLTPEQVRTLRERTEGWAAGLQLVGLSLRGREDRGATSPPSPAMIARSSITWWPRCWTARRPGCGSSCCAPRSCRASPVRCVTRCWAAPTPRDGWWSWSEPTCSWSPLDDRRVWYRYHHLFRELLAHELSLARPDDVAPLHRRAYEWHLREGLVAEAISHAIAAGDHDQAAELMAASWLDFVNRGELVTLEAWARPCHRRWPSPTRGCAWPGLGCSWYWGDPARWRLKCAPPNGALCRGRWRTDRARSSPARPWSGPQLGCSSATWAPQHRARRSPRTWSPIRQLCPGARHQRPRYDRFLVRRVRGRRERICRNRLGWRAPGFYAAEIYALGYLAMISAERAELAEVDERVAAARTLAERQALGEHWVTVMVYYAAGQRARAGGDLGGTGRDRARAEHCTARRVAP